MTHLSPRTGSHRCGSKLSNIIKCPNFRYFPPAKSNFIVWLFAQMSHIYLIEKEYLSLEFDYNTIILRYFSMSYDKRQLAAYYEAIY